MGLITSDDVIERFRDEVADNLKGPSDAIDNDALWKVGEVQRFLNAACARTSQKGRMLLKKFRLTVTAADGPFVRLPTGYKILDVQNAYSLGGRRKLTECNFGDSQYHDDYGQQIPVDPYYPYNETPTSNFAYSYVRDYDTKGILLQPRPVENDIIEMIATIEITEVPCGAPMPFDENEDIELIILWMKKLAYSKRDADTYYPDLAKEAEADFERRVVDRRYDAGRRRRSPAPAQFSW